MPTKCRDSDPPLGGVLYAGGSYSEGGSYMLVYTVLQNITPSVFHHLSNFR
jgi:hypothetical protein